MITRYTQLTGRYLKASKKRTILTIIGIVLSVALISSIGLFVKGMQDASIDNMKSTYGAYHLMFKNADENLLTKITSNPKVARYGFFTTGKEIKIDEEMSVHEMSATNSALELFPYKIKSGSMPHKEGEAAVEQWVIDKAFKGSKIGDIIKLDNKEFTLVGILENSIESQLNKTGILLTKNNNTSQTSGSLLVEISPKTNLKAAVHELEQLGQAGNVVENTPLLGVEGAGNEDSGFGNLYIVVGIIIGIVVISTIAVIYNSFQISVVERIKQFGLLRAVGTTPKQIRNIVLREATILAVTGVPLGLFFGVVAIFGIGFAFKLIGGDSVLPMKPVVSPPILGISGGVGIASIYMSALLPAIFAGRISPLVAISSRMAITKERYKQRKNKFVQKLLGFEAAMAFKNIKRNRKRYRITVFSIVISVVLFVTFKSFMNMALNISPPPNESKDIHFTIYFDNKSGMDDKALISLRSLDYVDKVYESYPSYGIEAAIDKSREIDKVKNIKNVYKETNINGELKALLSSTIIPYDAESLNAAKKYLEAGSIDIKKIDQENGVILINRDTILNASTKKKYVGPAANLKVGDDIELQYTGENGDKTFDFNNGVTKKAKIVAILNDNPFQGPEVPGLKLITTPEAAKALTGVSEVNADSFDIKLKDASYEKRAESDIEKLTAGKEDVNIINNIDENKRTKSVGLILEILLYGFVIVVSLIGSVNILNTITTNIILRKREFAALKSIGLTQKGLKKMIVMEGLLYSIFGTLYGSIIGSVLSYLMYHGLGGIREFSWNIPWQAIGIAGGAALVIGYISVLSPLSRINKDNIIDTIREDY